jgi:hypothetical protein
VSTDGTHMAVEISAVPLAGGERVVGVFGLVQGRPAEKPTAPHPHLTPRQVEVPRLLEHGCSSKQIAQELHLRMIDLLQRFAQRAGTTSIPHSDRL